MADTAATAHPCHGLFASAGERLTHRHWFQDDKLMPTCERCGTPIDREHKETGPVSWVPEKRREMVTLDDRYAISDAAIKALGEWLAWRGAGCDEHREVTVAQTLSFLRGLPNKLGYAHDAALRQEAVCTCQCFPTHQANDCPQHGLDQPTYTAGERVDCSCGWHNAAHAYKRGPK